MIRNVSLSSNNVAPRFYGCIVTLVTCLSLLLSSCNKPSKTRTAGAVTSAGVSAQGRRLGMECRSARASGANNTIDDFETGPMRIASSEGRGGYWFQYDDGTGGKFVRQQIVEGSRVLHVTASGFTDWGRWIRRDVFSGNHSNESLCVRRVHPFRGSFSCARSRSDATRTYRDRKHSRSRGGSLHSIEE